MCLCLHVYLLACVPCRSLLSDLTFIPLACVLGTTDDTLRQEALCVFFCLFWFFTAISPWSCFFPPLFFFLSRLHLPCFHALEISSSFFFFCERWINAGWILWAVHFLFYFGTFGVPPVFRYVLQASYRALVRVSASMKFSFRVLSSKRFLFMIKTLFLCCVRFCMRRERWEGTRSEKRVSSRDV